MNTTSVYVNRTVVKAEPFAAVIRREAEKQGGAHVLALRVAASGYMTEGTAFRYLQAIMSGFHIGRNGVRRDIQTISLDQADKILTALDLTHLLHGELADALIVPTCGRCGVGLEERTPGCSACAERVRRREVNARRSKNRRVQRARNQRRPLPVATSADASDERRVA